MQQEARQRRSVNAVTLKAIGALLLGLMLSGGAGVCLAGGVTAAIEPQVGSVGDEFTLSLTIEGKLQSQLEIPSIAGVEVSEGGKSSSVSIINGAMTSTATYYYRLQPQNAGDFTIPPIRVTIDGHEEATSPLAFKVQGAGNHLPGEGGESGEGLPLAFVERSVSKTDPYEGEAFVSTIKIYARIDVNGLQKAGKDSPDFRYEEIGQSSGRERVGDAIYEVITYQQVLIPQKAGRLELAPYQLDAELVMPSQRGRRSGGDIFSEFFNRGFGRVVKKRLASQPINLNVKPIPRDGRPAGYRGLVGQFQLNSQVSPQTLKQGATSTLTITIQGIGLLDTLGQNLDLDLGPQVKVYADKPTSESKADSRDGIVGRRTYKFALVPTQGGTIPLGAVKIPSFNPELGRFEVLTSELGALEVEAIKEERVIVTGNQGRGGEGQGGEQRRQTQVQALGRDLIDIHRNVRLDEAHDLTPQQLTWLVLLMVLPFSGYSGSLLWFYRRRHRQVDFAAQRRSRAYKNYRALTQKLKQARGQQQSAGMALEAYYRIYRDYLGDRFNAHGGALTLREIDEKFAEAGLPAESRELARRLSAEMDELSFSGRQLTSQHADELIALMEKVVGEVERR